MIGINLIKGGGYLNACSSAAGVPNTPYGLQYAKTGVAFIGMFYLNGPDNNYFQVKLIDSLITDKKYYIEYYVVNPKKYYRLACNNVSLFLSNKAVYTDTTNPFFRIIDTTAQVYNYGNPIIYDTTNWVKVSSIYRAKGGEKFITLGNFKKSSQTNYSIILPATGSYYTGAVYYVDDVSLIPLDSFNLQADAGRDTTIHIGDSAFIGTYTNGIDSIKWQILNSNGTIDSIRPGFWVHPLVNTCYVLTQTVNGFTSSDTVCVNVLPLPIQFTNYELRFTNEHTLNLSQEWNIENSWQTANEINVSHFYVQRSTNGKDFNIIGKVAANGVGDNKYSFVDNSPPSTVDSRPLTCYYRILSVDKDGKTSFSEVRNIEYRTRNHELRMYPNPSKGHIAIDNLASGTKTITITNVYGKIVQQLITRNKTAMLDIKTGSGMYFISITYAQTGNTQMQKVVIQ